MIGIRFLSHLSILKKRATLETQIWLANSFLEFAQKREIFKIWSRGLQKNQKLPYFPSTDLHAVFFKS